MRCSFNISKTAESKQTGCQPYEVSEYFMDNLMLAYMYLDIHKYTHHIFFKNGPFPASFSFSRLFNTVDSKCSI